MTLLSAGEQYGVLRGAGRGARGGGPGPGRHGALLQLPRHHHHPHQPHTLQAEWVPPYCHYYDSMATLQPPAAGPARAGPRCPRCAAPSRAMLPSSHSSGWTPPPSGGNMK